jgi:serine/threonine protein kinase
VAERQFGPYKLVRQIAVGGMAEIHLAKTKGFAGFEKYVALKMIHPNFALDDQFIEMLVDEAKIAVQLTHANIAQTFDLGRVGETYYITMEYVDGADLYKILRRASEMDLEMPLDVCAFIARDVASALDHAHRKRDATGKPLGIVHRDVSPQNVLVSYAGEVKLVDFGIAKATMKARQTAVGVIKGKYYYMSPEQAWGDPIDYRSDIFSAGIVLYELITGQMLYLEEDLHKLLEMARKADIAPPSTLRKGVPPQLERIVMHALAKNKEDRYQSAGDFATDLERFLHAYSPVFTGAKVAGVVRQVVGDPVPVPADFPSIEIRDGAMSTQPIDLSEVAHAADADRMRDENSVIFRVADLKPPEPPPPPPPAPRKPAPTPRPAPVVAKQPTPAKPLPSVKVPIVTQVRVQPAPAPVKIPPIAKPASPPTPRPIPSAVPKPRQIDEETRRLESPLVVAPREDSQLFDLGGESFDTGGTADEDLDALENIGERTMITAPVGGFMLDGDDTSSSSPFEDLEEGGGATMITAIPTAAAPHASRPAEIVEDDDDRDHEPTITREAAPPAPRTQKPGRAAPPPALAAKIHAPAVSELRKPRASRRTPPGGSPTTVPNVLQAIVGAQSSEPMPAPRPTVPARPPATNPRAHAPTAPPTSPTLSPDRPDAVPPSYQPPNYPGYPQPPVQQPSPMASVPTAAFQAANQPTYPEAQAYQHQPQSFDASGMPLGVQTPPGMAPLGPDGVPPHLQPYLHVPGYPPPQQPVSPGALYQFTPQGGQPQRPLSITGQMRLWEADEMPSQYKLSAARNRWLTYIIAGVLAISVAAGVTFFIIKATRNTPPALGTVKIDSVPPGAEVVFDGERLTDKTPLSLPGVPPGTHHDIRLELARHQPYTETIDIPKGGGDVAVTALLKPVTGKLVVNSRPGGAEIRIDDEVRGRTPTTITDIDMTSAKHIELRLKDYQPYVQDLTWPSNGQIDLDVTLKK